MCTDEGRFRGAWLRWLEAAKFELVEEGTSTRLIFDHAGFPQGTAEHLAAGWKENYWEPLAKYLAQ